jgi:hypothetical protein
MVHLPQISECCRLVWHVIPGRCSWTTCSSCKRTTSDILYGLGLHANSVPGSSKKQRLKPSKGVSVVSQREVSERSRRYANSWINCQSFSQINTHATCFHQDALAKFRGWWTNSVPSQSGSIPFPYRKCGIIGMAVYLNPRVGPLAAWRRDVCIGICLVKRADGGDTRQSPSPSPQPRGPESWDCRGAKAGDGHGV